MSSNTTPVPVPAGWRRRAGTHNPGAGRGPLRRLRRRVPAAPAALALAAGAGLAVPQAAHAVSSVSVSSTTVTAALPPGVSATGRQAGCTTGTGTVTCTFGAIANGAGAAKSFRVPLHLFSLGHVTVTGTRTASTPADPNPADDTDSATCTVVSVLPATCP